MNPERLSASQAARRVGTSVKALRIYERRGLLKPERTAKGYRRYGPDDLSRATRIVALRALGLSLTQISRVLSGEPHVIEATLAAHEARLVSALEKLRALRAPKAGRDTALSVSFELPWPWGGERFELTGIRRLNYIVGSLGSGKTRLAQRLAELLPGGVYLGLDRREPASDARIAPALARLVADGATATPALRALLWALESDGYEVLVVEMVEQGLNPATQKALAAFLRRRAAAGARPLFLMTRSNVMLDLGTVGPDETLILCPANHSVPVCVDPHPGAPGREALAMCLASPDVRARVS